MGRLARNLFTEEPAPVGLRFAAVSIILSDRRLPRVLLIKRAERSGDPWSGQIAFPGGKVQQGDGSARGTAIRETFEEVGIDLAKAAEFLGYGRVTGTHTGSLDVAPAVFLLKRKVVVTPNGEVASYRWASLNELLSPSSRSVLRFDFQGTSAEMPAFLVGDYVVWGLTYRILSQMLDEPR